jgi:tetratricopeptide (TPR) repeat protein
MVGKDLSDDVAKRTVPVSRLGLRGPVLVGDWQAPPAGYLPRRHVEEKLAQVWDGRATGGRNAAWLHGATGVGKTMVARRIADQAIHTTEPDREEIIMWVDSADPAALTAAYLKLAEQVPALGVVVGDGEPGQARREAAMKVRNKLAGAGFRWLVVLDNADPASLAASGLLPPNTTKTGRVLATTTHSDPHFGAYADGIPVGLYDPAEAPEYVKSRRDPRDPSKPAALAQAPDDDIQALVEATGRHPLALAIATATITANPPLTIPAWLKEFDPPAMDRAAAVAQARCGDRHLATGNLPAARHAFQESLDIARELARMQPGSVQARHDLAVSLNRIGDLDRQAGDLPAARKAYQESFDIARELADLQPGSVQARRDLSISLQRIGHLGLQAGDLTAARQSYQEALDIARELSDLQPGSVQARRDLSISLAWIGDLDQQAGDQTAARKSYQEYLEIARELADLQPGSDRKSVE